MKYCRIHNVEYLFDCNECKARRTMPCKHNRSGYCFDCVRERHNQEVLDGKYDDIDDDYASTPHPSAYYKSHD